MKWMKSVPVGHLLVGLAVLLAMAMARVEATEVTMKDGNVFVGEIISKTDAAIVLDAKLGSSRARLTIPQDRIASVKEGPVPEGFFDPPKADARKSNPADFASTDQVYLEVPVNGRFGESVFASGFERIVAYAKQNRIPNLVFVIDSRDSTNIDEARKVFQVLQRAKEDLTYHAVVRQATGDSLGVLMLCDTIHLLPGAVIGGAPVKAKEGESQEELAVLLHQRAQRVGQVAESLHRSAPLVRAMIDPSEKLTCWIGEDGRPASGVDAPADVSAGQIVFSCPAGQILVLTFEQLQRLGVPVLKGSVVDLGAALGHPVWKAESDYGQKTMARMAQEEQTALQAKEQLSRQKAERLISRRTEVRDAIKGNLAQAASWDPGKGSYSTSTYQVVGRWGWGGGSTDSNRLTSESRKRWTERSDMTAGYIREAVRAIRTMKSLEAQAAQMGLEPLYVSGELDRMERDLVARGESVIQNRERREK